MWLAPESQTVYIGLIFTLVLVLLTIPIMGNLYSKRQLEVDGKVVLLTGASEGMGKQVAKQFASKGASVVVVARDVGKLETAILDIRASARDPNRQWFSYISADVSRPEENQRILSELMARNNGQAPDVVWCMAGVSKPALFLDSTPEIIRSQMDVNYFSCVELAHAVLSIWLSPDNLKLAKKRHLIFTSSVLAFYPITGYSPYSPAKAAIRSLIDSLAQEVLLYTKDVKIHGVFPGSINTAGFAEENRIKPEVTKILEKDDPVQEPEMVAKKAIAGLERGERLVTVHILGAAMRACAWSGSPRNNWFTDTIFSWIVSIAWFFIAMDLDGKVSFYGQKHGHPSVYKK